MAAPLLSVKNLTVEYRSRRGVTRAVDNVSLEIGRGEIVGLAGESGSGKSTMVLALTRLLRPPGRVVQGEIRFAGEDLLAMPPEALRRFRWERMSLVFQSAMNSLNPVLTIGDQFDDMFRAHGVPKGEREGRSVELMRMVRIDPAVLKSYPHELSGGMRQRAVIAMALALRPDLVIMDEPTTALDVVVERGIIAEIRRLQAEFGFSVLFVTHDMALLATVASRITVMYAGRVVENGPASVTVRAARHPYTRALVASFPRVRGERSRIAGIPGALPDMRRPPSGCRFHPRCPAAMAVCAQVEPVWTEDGPQGAACHLYDAEEGEA
jgi:peptide/nickel transport system ATP-binding protein